MMGKFVPENRSELLHVKQGRCAVAPGSALLLKAQLNAQGYRSFNMLLYFLENFEIALIRINAARAGVKNEHVSGIPK